MLKRIVMMVVGVFGVASMAMAGTQINTLTTSPGFQRSGGSLAQGRPLIHGKIKLSDLIPQAGNPFRGSIRVKNQGAATAGASKVVLSCRKVGHVGGGGGCVDSPALNRYFDASLGGMAFPVPALRPGQTQTVRVPGWGSLHWPNGGYIFTIMADGGRVVAESNERNNKIKASMKVAGKPVLRGKKPDLIPLVRGSNPFSGTFKVKNRGGATAGASKLVIICKKVGHRGPGGGCADSPALHSLASLDGGLVAPVPSLRAGQVYTVSLPVRGLKWAKGKYKFTVKADATRAVAESNERNNVKSMVRRQR